MFGNASSRRGFLEVPSAPVKIHPSQLEIAPHLSTVQPQVIEAATQVRGSAGPAPFVVFRRLGLVPPGEICKRDGACVDLASRLPRLDLTSPGVEDSIGVESRRLTQQLGRPLRRRSEVASYDVLLLGLFQFLWTNWPVTATPRLRPPPEALPRALPPTFDCGSVLVRHAQKRACFDKQKPKERPR
jgi:hypothetical protein